MTIVGKFNAVVDIARFVEELLLTYPGSTVISDDYYRDRIAASEHVARSLDLRKDAGPPECLYEVAYRIGLQYRLEIQVAPGSVADVRVDRNGLLATGDCLSDGATARRFARVLSSFPLVVELD